jgi:pseudoazurin
VCQLVTEAKVDQLKLKSYIKHMIKNLKKRSYKIFLTLFIICFSSNVFAADVTVEMLNKMGKEMMVYSKKIVRVNVGETVIWKATDKGHNVEFIKGGVPDGVDKFKSKYNVDTQYKFTIPGIYAYWCTPHKNMGMIGFVVVGGDKSNIDSIKAIRFSSKSKKIAPDLINQL